MFYEFDVINYTYYTPIVMLCENTTKSYEFHLYCISVFICIY